MSDMPEPADLPEYVPSRWDYFFANAPVMPIPQGEMEALLGEEYPHKTASVPTLSQTLDRVMFKVRACAEWAALFANAAMDLDDFV
jgi:hypothetical protein